MRLRLKVLIGILITLISINGIWVIYDIRNEIALNKELAQKEIKINDQVILDIYKNLDKINNKLDNNYKDLNRQVQNVPERERVAKIKLEQTLKQINIMIVNKTFGSLGSGVSIKYKGKFYILTAGHMADTDTDELYLYENNNQICRLEIVKHDYSGGAVETTSKDLLLLKPVNENIQPRFYTEIADNEPVTGTQVYVVGNPMGIEDVISDGRVIFYKDNFMYYIDHTYFGNSGGGVYNADGKVVGIVSHMANLKPAQMFGAPDYIIAGAVRLDTILAFMRNVE